MRRKLERKIQIPTGITCEVIENKVICKKDSLELSREIPIPGTKVLISQNEILISNEKGNKNDYKKIVSLSIHLKNILSGLEDPFIYKLESCNVHFPTSLKIEGDKLEISNFLGEKVKRYAEILPGVNVDIKGPNITLSSHNLESAGQTAANFEKATKVRGRDPRVFQDGIYIVEKPVKRKIEVIKPEEGKAEETIDTPEEQNDN